jgi:uncharacterized phiE125 gp8 family phage protein
MFNDLPFRLYLASPPAVEPVTLAEARAHTRVDDTADNSLVQALITAARRAAEAYTRRAFITQSWAMYFDEAPTGNYFEIPKAPLVGISSIVTYSDADAATTFAASNYYVDLITRPGRVVLRSTADWPTFERVANGFVVNFVAGYGATGSDVPAEIRQAILMIVSHLYENRGDTDADMPRVAQMLLDPYKDWAF